METQTHFDLTAALENWRRDLAAQSPLSADDQRELETHLRDSLAELQRRGLSAEESFWLARRRVGLPQELAEEFIKADPAKIWRERIFWMAVSLVGSYVFMTWKDLLTTFINENSYGWVELLYLIPLLSLIAGVVLLRRGRLPQTQRIENIAPWKLASGLFAIMLTTILCAYGRSHHLPGNDLINIGYNIGMTLSWYANAVWPFVTVLILLLTLKRKPKTPQAD